MIDRALRFKKDDPLDENARLGDYKKQEWREMNWFFEWTIDDFNNTNWTPNSLFQKWFGKQPVDAFID